MDNIQGMNDMQVPRYAYALLAKRLSLMPVVVLTGARQTGKTTLARTMNTGERRFHSLDDLDVLDLAQRDPQALVGGAQPVTLDEVQREPRLLSTIKRVVDRQRRSGQFLLTGSANLLLMRKVSESLAGRASYLTLWPMTGHEQRGRGRCGLWEELLAADEKAWINVLGAQDPEPEDWHERVRTGGFPVPAVHMNRAEDRAVWFEGYVRTYLERDLRELSSVASLPDFRRLMRAAALRLGGLTNQTELGRDVGLPQPTVHRYLNLLETSYLLVRVPPYAVNRTKRLVKSPKLYWGDVGLALHLAGDPEPDGTHLENLVLQDLLAWRDAREGRAEILFWRTSAGQEVDFVIEAGGQLLPLEVKTSSRARAQDTAGLRAFRAEYRDTARAGLLLYAGEEFEWLTHDVLAVPWWAVC